MYYEEIKFWVLFIIGLSMFAYCFERVMDEIKDRRILKEKDMLLNIHINDDYMNIIDSIIEESIIKYRAINIDHDPKFYMSTKEQEKIIKEVLEDVLLSISPVFYEQACLVYNKEKLEDIILTKINMRVLSLTIEINGSYKEI